MNWTSSRRRFLERLASIAAFFPFHKLSAWKTIVDKNRPAGPESDLTLWYEEPAAQWNADPSACGGPAKPADRCVGSGPNRSVWNRRSAREFFSFAIAGRFGYRAISGGLERSGRFTQSNVSSIRCNRR
jgi:hypothetical protein